jgi:hypothetical protein
MELAVLPFWGFCVGLVVGLMVAKAFTPAVCRWCNAKEGELHRDRCPLREENDD